MRQVAFITTAAVVLAGASPAYAAINKYSVMYKFPSHDKGTVQNPQPLSFTEAFNIRSATPGNRSGVLLDTKNVIYGVKIDTTGFPTCTVAEIGAAGSDSGCDSRAELATGYIDADIGNEQNFALRGAACDPAVDFWNAGPGKIAIFNVTDAQHVCLGGQLHTGGVPPYEAFYTMRGKNLVIDNPMPTVVNFPLGPTGGLVGTLSKEHLVWKSQSDTIKGKKVASITSVGCQGSERPIQTSFTATLPPAGPAKEVTTVHSSASC